MSLGFNVPAGVSAKEDYQKQLVHGDIVVQHCSNCGHPRYPARSVCAECLAEGCDWLKVSGRGHIEAFVWYLDSFDRNFVDVPYCIALVHLDAGVRLFGRVLDVTAIDDVATGDRVQAHIVDDARTGHRLDFRIAPPQHDQGASHAGSR